jgi:hypothetical protein
MPTGANIPVITVTLTVWIYGVVYVVLVIMTCDHVLLFPILYIDDCCLVKFGILMCAY